MPELSYTIRMVPLADLILDKSLQIRSKVDQNVATAYANLMEDGVEFDPIDVFQPSGGGLYVADGWHRVHANRKRPSKPTEIKAKVYTGDRRAAQLFAMEANQKHGIHFSTADKRRAVVVLLSDDEWKGWSVRDIAKKAGVGKTFVNGVQLEMRAKEKEAEEKAKRDAEASTESASQEGKQVSVADTSKEYEQAQSEPVEEIPQPEPVQPSEPETPKVEAAQATPPEPPKGQETPKDEPSAPSRALPPVEFVRDMSRGALTQMAEEMMQELAAWDDEAWPANGRRWILGRLQYALHCSRKEAYEKQHPPVVAPPEAARQPQFKEKDQPKDEKKRLTGGVVIGKRAE